MVNGQCVQETWIWVWLWASNLPSLNLSLHIWKIRNTALPSSKSYCDNQIVISDAEVPCKLWETSQARDDDNNVGGKGQGDGDNKELKKKISGTPKDYLFLVQYATSIAP